MIDSSSRKNGPTVVQPLDSDLETREPQYWRTRADEARTVAGTMVDPFSRQMMANVAASYDKLAEWAEKRR
jgi:hypothetical protein